MKCHYLQNMGLCVCMLCMWLILSNFCNKYQLYRYIWWTSYLETNVKVNHYSYCSIHMGWEPHTGSPSCRGSLFGVNSHLDPDRFLRILAETITNVNISLCNHKKLLQEKRNPWHEQENRDLFIHIFWVIHYKHKKLYLQRLRKRNYLNVPHLVNWK